MFHFFGNGSKLEKCPLDLIGGPRISSASYSLRKLHKRYNGYIIRVRRSRDNAELNIPLYCEDLCQKTLLNFVGSDNAYIVIWYDQSGNGKNLSNISIENQPRIVNGGQIETVNGRPSIYFDGINDALNIAEDAKINNIMTASVVVNNTELLNDSRIFSISNGNSAQFSIYQSIDGSIFVGNKYPEAVQISYGYPLTSLSLLTIIRNSTVNMQTWLNGIDIGNIHVPTTSFSERLYVGNNESTSYWKGYISELIFFTPLTVLAKQKLEQNQSKYYGIELNTPNIFPTWNDINNWNDVDNWSE